MYDKILVPTDGSEGAEVAVEHAIDLAKKYDAELHAVYVVDVRAGSAADMWANLLSEFEEIGEEATEGIKTRAREAGVKAVAEVVRGIPHREINDYAGENSVDLIVMGTHGRSGLDRILLGSVTEKVVRTSEIPVLTVGREE
ncbi:MAG: universal stress protein [Candidatus Nanohalobium sp.]